MRRQTRSAKWLYRAIRTNQLLISAVVQGRDATGVSPEALAQLPPLSVRAAQFEQRELHARVGQTMALRLETADGQGHSFDVDGLNVHAPMPSGKPGLALFTPSKPGTYTFYCALHYDKASGQGMKGTLIVAP